MGEKENYLASRERELATTINVLSAYPGAGEIRPAEKSKTARELAWTFVAEEVLMQKLIDGKDLMSQGPKMDGSLADAIAMYKKISADMTKKIKGMSEKDFEKKVDFFVAPKKIGKERLGSLLWMFLMDQIHHRGQFSVYVRIAGGKLPSIYGPTADQPWT